MQFFFNPFREPVPQTPVDAAVRKFHRGMADYRPTPLRVSAELARAAGVRTLMVKDESARFGLNSFKILGASWAMSQLTAGGAAPQAVAAATAGNHGRAVAWMARQMGVKAHILAPAGTILRSLLNIRKEGAEVSVVAGDYDAAVRTCAAESRKRGWRVISDTGYPGCTEMPTRIVEGYSTLFAEYEEQRSAQQLPEPDVVLVQAGVGGLLSAAVRHFRADRDPRLVCVEPEGACCLLESIRSPGGKRSRGTGPQTSIMTVLNCAEVSLTAWPAIRGGVDLFLAIEDRHALEAVRLLREHCIDAAESGAAGMAGLLALCADPRFREAKTRLGLSETSNVMVINTEGALEARKGGRG